MTADRIDSLQHEGLSFPPPAEFSAKAHIKSLEAYEEMYRRSIEDPNGFWAEQADTLDWYKKWDVVEECDFNKLDIKYFSGGKLNASQNCLDRHLSDSRRNKAALIWEGEPGDRVTLTYQELHYEVCRFANVLKKHGVKKGDRVSLYMPMIPELAIAMLACARIGAPHCVIFAGFSSQAICDRIHDAGSKIIVTADGGYRAGRAIALKGNINHALALCPSVKTCIVVARTGQQVDMVPGRDIWWHTEMESVDAVCEPEHMDSEDLLFLLYTSGSTGKPKGVMHTTAGYLLFTMLTFQYVFDYRDEDIFWCTADIGWITGHSYLVYGPLALGATSFMFEGVPTYPVPDKFWELIEKYKINSFYTAPTVIRVLMATGGEWPARRDLSSLRLLGSVGEPINPEAWMWYYKNIGHSKCPIVDTWWQTETGGHLITPLPGAMTQKPGSANRPFFGVEPTILRADGSEADINEGGMLCIKKSWPGMLRGVYNDPDKTRFREIYFSMIAGVYFSGDGARKDEDGDYWLLGRIDDVVNVSGHRIGTSDVESALVSHSMVAEAAVVGYPHDIKGQGLYAYVTLNAGVEKTDALKKILIGHVREEIGPIATLDVIQFADGLPKTRSGKIMRRILRKIAEGDTSNLGDTSTLSDPLVIDDLVTNATPGHALK